MTGEQEIKIAHAIQLLHESEAVFICLYGFPNEVDTYVEGRGDGNQENRQNFLLALAEHWGESLD